MKCPFCYAQDTKVVDSRPVQDGLGTRRRRKCENCQKRFSTLEKAEMAMPLVIKNDGRRENFDKAKIQDGIEKACQKRPVGTSQIENIVGSVERNVIEKGVKEISTKTIGEFIMSYLRILDPVAYVRFASVYKTFQDIDEFVKDLEEELPSKTYQNSSGSQPEATQ
ncbi:MAG: transcriptional repressor NrdR [Bacteriovoracaceae bacterium]|jgi:transcriptional repressor NrdR|nr:transcriptional repressor NrdR [Bacteriovoracaceae bacterium]